jgi:hypothetical protein
VQVYNIPKTGHTPELETGLGALQIPPPLSVSLSLASCYISAREKSLCCWCCC